MCKSNLLENMLFFDEFLVFLSQIMLLFNGLMKWNFRKLSLLVAL